MSSLFFSYFINWYFKYACSSLFMYIFIIIKSFYHMFVIRNMCKYS